MSVRFKNASVSKKVPLKHSYTVECGNRLRVGVGAKNASVSGCLHVGPSKHKPLSGLLRTQFGSQKVVRGPVGGYGIQGAQKRSPRQVLPRVLQEIGVLREVLPGCSKECSRECPMWGISKVAVSAERKFPEFFRIFCPEFCPEVCSEFSPNFARSFLALMIIRGKRRPQKIHQKSPPFFNAKIPR